MRAGIDGNEKEENIVSHARVSFTSALGGTLFASGDSGGEGQNRPWLTLRSNCVHCSAARHLSPAPPQRARAPKTQPCPQHTRATTRSAATPTARRRPPTRRPWEV